ncbi:HipA family kinase [Jatrophihabitans sp. YIM 134969]
MLPRVDVVRYVTPLREGGSLPGLMEADDLGTYVVKFRGAGQGLPVLVAEVIAAGLARALELPVPDLVVAALDAGFAAGEPDEEVQDLLRASAGDNLGVDFLPGALDADRIAVERGADPAFAGRVLWFDAYVNNVDRTWRNPNMLWWGGQLWLIDHGASLTFHHNWSGADAAVHRAYRTDGHVMLDRHPDLAAADAFSLPRLSDDVLTAVVADVPDDWLAVEDLAPSAVRERYVAWLAARRDAHADWVPA